MDFSAQSKILGILETFLQIRGYTEIVLPAAARLSPVDAGFNITTSSAEVNQSQDLHWQARKERNEPAFFCFVFSTLKLGPDGYCLGILRC